MSQVTVPEIYQPLFQSPKRKNILYGGRGSGKSHTVARFVLLRAVQKKELVLCTRELQNTLADSVHSLLAKCIDEMGLSSFFTVQREAIVGRNGSKFLFAGVRSNVNEIKSMEGVTICWVEEAQAMTQNSLDVLIPTIRQEGSILIFTFNPFKDTDPVYLMAKNAGDDTLVIHANFEDNPFFPDVLRQEEESCRRTDYDKWLWVWQGECLGIAAAQIFRGKYKVEAFETPADADFHFGVDWGFSQDPTVIVRSFIVGNTLYIDWEAGGVGIDLPDIPSLFAKVPGSMIFSLYADNARPETISYVNSRGYHCIPAEKWQGSVEDGVDYLKGFDQIIIHPRCPMCKEEFDLYQYKQDKQTNEILRIPLDKYNHCIDALRYAHTVSMRGKSNGRMYPKFSLRSILPKDIDTPRDVWIGTYTVPGQTLTVTFCQYRGLIVCIDDFTVKGSLNFEDVKSRFPEGTHITWFPYCTLEEVPQGAVNSCIVSGIEPAVGCVLPPDVEGTLLVNKLFEAGQLAVAPRCLNIRGALTDRVFLAEGKIESEAKQNRVHKQCIVFEYAVWRLVGRLGGDE